MNIEKIRQNTSLWNLADHLVSDDDIIAILQVLKDEDKETILIILDGVITALKNRRKNNAKGDGWIVK